MSTADCKSLLVEHYPETLAKEWKRESKFKNVFEEEVRRFRHPKAGVVLVCENRNKVSTDGMNLLFRMHSTYTASDFYFTVVMTTEDDFDWPHVKANVWVGYKHSRDNELYDDDLHWEWVMRSFFPKGIKMQESMECCFEIEEDLTKTQLEEMFLAAGFQTSTLFDQVVLESLD